MSMKIVAVPCMSALCGCAGLVRETREPAVERLDVRGVSSPMLLVEAGSALRFVNADPRPHQIYSNDCGEGSSTLLNPGDIYSTQVRTGPNGSHFPDLFAPPHAGFPPTLPGHPHPPPDLLSS